MCMEWLGKPIKLKQLKYQKNYLFLENILNRLSFIEHII